MTGTNAIHTYQIVSTITNSELMESSLELHRPHSEPSLWGDYDRRLGKLVAHTIPQTPECLPGPPNLMQCECISNANRQNATSNATGRQRPQFTLDFKCSAAGKTGRDDTKSKSESKARRKPADWNFCRGVSTATTAGCSAWFSMGVCFFLACVELRVWSSAFRFACKWLIFRPTFDFAWA